MPPETDLTSYTVLFVEDDEMTRKLLSRTLERRLGKVYTAENGKQGMEVYARHADEIHLVITDIQMPVMDGLTMAELLREENPHMPVIIISAYSDPEYREKAEKIGIKDYLNKPVNLSDIFISLQKVLAL
jgi:YesN/AraC family two-component response regulator